jgi:hypothetical protein
MPALAIEWRPHARYPENHDDRQWRHTGRRVLCQPGHRDIGRDRETGGIYASQNWTVANYGSIGGTTGILLRAGGSVVNKGTIASQTVGYLTGAGAITNAGTGALISGLANGVQGSGTVFNAGTITSQNGEGVYLVDVMGSGFVSNSALGLIQGYDGIKIGGTGHPTRR